MTPKAIFAAAALFACATAPALSAPPDAKPNDRPMCHEDKNSQQGPSHEARMAGPQEDRKAQPPREVRGDKASRDRYWRKEYRGLAAHDQIYAEARRRGYSRYDGEPVWKDGRFVLKSRDRKGKPVFLEFNPYTGSFIAVLH